MISSRAFLRGRTHPLRDLTWELPLSELVRRHTRIRRPPPGPANGSHKGWEARMTFATTEELESARDALRDAGFHPGRPFAKRSGWVLPVYGEAAVRRLWRLGREDRA